MTIVRLPPVATAARRSTDWVQRPPFVQEIFAAAEAGAGDVGVTSGVGREMRQVEPTVARTENRPSAVWAEAGALENASGAKARPSSNGVEDMRWRRRVIPTRLRFSG